MHHITVIQNQEVLNIIAEITTNNREIKNSLYGAKTPIISAPKNSFHAEQLDVGIMSQTILSEATDLELNSIVMTRIVPALKEERLVNILNLPNSYIPFVGIAIGNTDDKSIKSRKYHDDNVTYIL